MTGAFLNVGVPDETMQTIAKMVEQRLSDRLAENHSPWMTAPEAAAYLRCGVSRIRKLCMTNAIPVHRDGGRVLFHRDELDEFVRAGGAFAG